MTISEPGVALHAALRRLLQTGQELRHSAQQPLTPDFPGLRNLMAALTAQAAVRPRRCPASYRLAWESYLVDAQQPLSSRAVRYLSWEPTVATTERFQSYLDAEVGVLSARTLQGLVWCSHMCWSAEFAASAVARQIHRRLATYTGTDSMIERWRQHADVLVGPGGPRVLAAALVAQRAPIASWCHTWGIDARSPYFLAVMCAALPQCMRAMGEELALRSYLLSTLLPWPQWSTKDFYTAMGAAVLHPVTPTTAGMPERLMTLALADPRLGDPRLPSQHANWRTFSKEAQQRVSRWLSHADIAFFFNEVLPKSKDQEERNTFWLRYARRVLRSRPLLNEADRRRLAFPLQQMPEMTEHFGCINGAYSALILDFGAVVMVQVSDLDDACYVYGKRSFERLVPDFWQVSPFVLEELLVTQHAAMIYYHPEWERDVMETLTLCNLQPSYTLYNLQPSYTTPA